MIMNKAFCLLVICFLAVSVTNAQEFSFGVKGGVNYVSGGQITGLVGGGTDNGDTFTGESQIGIHGGGFFEVRFNKFLIRPEVVYSQMDVEFAFPVQPSTYAIEKVSVPLLVGYNIWGPVDVYAGPAYQKILDVSLEGNEADEPVIVQNSPLAAQAGIKAGFGRFELDLRYDRTLASKEPYNINIVRSEYGVNRASFDDGRLNQIMLSLSFKIFDSAANPGRRKGGCYF